MFIRLAWKSLLGTKTQGYYENSQIMDKNSFITLAQGLSLCVHKDFCKSSRLLKTARRL